MSVPGEAVRTDDTAAGMASLSGDGPAGSAGEERSQSDWIRSSFNLSSEGSSQSLESTVSRASEIELLPDEEGAANAQESESKLDLLHGWRSIPENNSLEEVHRTVKVPDAGAPWYVKLTAFFGVGFMICVGYMDPGNWATDIAGGSQFGYTLLTVVLMSSLLAMFLQSLSLKLGAVAERDLAQACRDAFPRWVSVFLWITAEIAIAACDMAEVIGCAMALYLLFGLPVWIGVLLTATDALFIIFFGLKRLRYLEFFVVFLCLLIAGCLIYELSVAHPDWAQVFKGFVPSGDLFTVDGVLYSAIGIMGATIMPHNIYLHSSLIQTRDYPRTAKGKTLAVRYGSIDSILSLAFALFVNASILTLAAAAFYYGAGGGSTVADINDAYYLISGALGQEAAKIVFGVSLLASGLSSTITGTLAGQIVMEGFLNFKLKPWIRRLVTRLVAIVPAVIVAAIGGNKAAGKLLILSQVILSLQLPFAVGPLVLFTSSRKKMGSFVNGWISTIFATFAFCLVTGLNCYLVVQAIVSGSFM